MADKAADTHAVAALTKRIKTLPTFLMMDGKETASVASEEDGENEGGMQEDREAGRPEKSSRKWWIWLWGERRGVDPDHVARPERDRAGAGNLSAALRSHALMLVLNKTLATALYLTHGRFLQTVVGVAEPLIHSTHISHAS